MQEDIQIANIEKELEKLWEENKNKVSIKACLFNLIVYTEDPKSESEQKELLKATVEKYPCRILFVKINTEKSLNFVKVHVANEVVGVGSTAFTYDQIIIDASINQLNRIPFILLPNLAADLPIYILWGQDPLSNSPLLAFFEEIGSTLIFDTAYIKDLKNFSNQILEKIDGSTLNFIDLKWIRTSSWCQILQDVFQTEGDLKNLKRPESIDITYNTLTNMYEEVELIYLISWLTYKMGWKCIGREILDNGKKYLFETFSLNIYYENKDFLPSGIIEMEVVGKEDCIYSLSADIRSQKIRVHISNSKTCKLPFTMPLPTLNKKFPFIKELFYSPTSKSYIKVLQTLKDILCINS